MGQVVLPVQLRVLLALHAVLLALGLVAGAAGAAHG
jgi:hypothetical protein